MTLTAILTFSLVASLLVISPGPNGVLIAKTVPTSGRKAGFANIAGFVAAFYLHGALSILGISVLLVNSATAFMFVKYLGAAYLCWIGAKALWSAYKGHVTSDEITPARHKRSLHKAFFEGLITNAFNPKVSMFYLAAFPQFIPTGADAIASSFLLVFIHSIINAVWFGALIILFSYLTNFSRSNRGQRWLKGVTGVVFIGFGAKLAAHRPAV